MGFKKNDKVFTFNVKKWGFLRRIGLMVGEIRGDLGLEDVK